MKNINKVLSLLFAIAILASSCEKQENKVYYTGGTSPVLTSSSTANQVLTFANAANNSILLSWTNPNYQFTTGISSQDVIYNIQVDTTGANFTSPLLQEIPISKELSKQFTVTELNTVLARLNLLENVPHNIEMRVRSTLTNNSLPLYSNVLKIIITPYLDVAVPLPPTGDLYVTGDATPGDWVNTPPAAQKFTKQSTTVFTKIINLGPGKFYKFLSTQGQWQPQYGGSSATGGDLGYNMGGGSDPAAIPTPGLAGSYLITVNFKTGRYDVVKQ